MWNSEGRAAFVTEGTILETEVNLFPAQMKVSIVPNHLGTPPTEMKSVCLSYYERANVLYMMIDANAVVIPESASAHPYDPLLFHLCLN